MGKKVTPKITRSTAQNQIDRIKENLIKLRQKAMADVVQDKLEDVIKGKISIFDCMEQLTGIQLDKNEDNRIESNKTQARFPFFKTLKEYDLSRPKRINKQLIDYLATCNFIEEGKNILIFGPSRVGKTHIAIGLGYEAICQANPTLFVDLTDLIVKLTHKNITKQKEETLLTTLQNKKLLIFDEIREQEVNPNARTFLFRLIKYRNEKRKPIIFTSMQSLEKWKTVFYTDRDSIVNRILERSIEVIIEGKPYRV